LAGESGLTLDEVRGRVIAAMAACVVPLLALPLARRVFDVRLPPANVLLANVAIAAGAIIGLSVHRGSFRRKDL
jgi:hypothetical protein